MTEVKGLDSDEIRRPRIWMTTMLPVPNSILASKQLRGFALFGAFCTVITPNVREYADWQHPSPNSHKQHDPNSVYQASWLWNDGIGESATKIDWLFSWRVNVLTPIETVKGNERARIDGVIPLFLFCYTHQRADLHSSALDFTSCPVQ